MGGDGYALHFEGAPTVAQLAEVVEATKGLLNAVAGRELAWATEARCRCDSCGAQSEPVDLSNPTAATATLREAGWVAEPDVPRDLCPDCASKDGS
jgi:hypothetical protein